MITFKAIIIPNNRRKDGTYPVKIRVTFRGVSRRLPTTLVCKSNDITRGNKIKNADILMKSDELINRMRSAVKDLSPFDLENQNVDWVVGKIRDSLAGENFRLDFFEWCDRFVKTKAETTRTVYETSLNAFERFLGKRSIDINAITRMLLLDFMEFVDDEPKMYRKKDGQFTRCKTKKIPKRSSARHIAMLQHMFEAAKVKYNDEDTGRILIPKSPFKKIDKTLPATEHSQKNIGKEAMQKLISYETDNPRMRRAIDAFVVSFGVMGANVADLYNAPPVKNLWIYNRQKTRDRREDKAEMRVEIPAVLLPYIKRLQEGDTKKWWLPGLHQIGAEKDYCTKNTNKYLKAWCEENEVERFTTYAARHTWASLARKAGVEKATIDECLAHKGLFDLTDTYAERSWELMQEANRKVLDMFEW